MMRFLQGNLLDAPTEAVVNTVNTVGVMGKGIALMFKEAFPDNFRIYEEAAKREQVQIGHMFVTENRTLEGPRWLINFPTKKHWRQPSRLEWIVEGLQDLRRVVEEKGIQSIALPPLGCGNGGLDWSDVRPEIERALGQLSNVDVWVFEPTAKYQNVAKRAGVMKLTPARVLVAEIVRRYWVLGIECTNLEVQKLCWFLERTINELSFENPLDLRFVADKYGPYSERLRHLLNGLDGSYLHCDKRLSDAGPSDTIWFDEERRPFVDLYLRQENARHLTKVLDRTAERIDGFESPLGMELLATVDWLIEKQHCGRNLASIREGLRRWPTEPAAAERKQRLFNDRLITLALAKLDSDFQLTR
jgi:O-acetyl-ADP-ribose deacetylase (regulator of RNase III)